MKYIVYQTTNLVNNKIYIGVHKTKDPEIFDSYLGCGIKINIPSSYMNPTTPLQFAVKKYGTSKFKRSTIKVFDTPEDAYALEAQIVDLAFINRADTYNAKLGGLGGCSYYVKVYQYNKDGELIKSWDSIMEASEFIGVSHTAIINAIKLKGSCRGFFWTKEECSDFSSYSYYSGTVCYKYNSDGIYIDTYNSMSEAAKLNNVLLSSIERAVKGDYKVGGFYYSSKLVEVFKPKEKISLRNKTLYVYDLNGAFITELHSTKEITDFFKIKSVSSITTSMRLERPYKEYQLSLEKKNKLSPVVSKRNKAKKVVCLTLGGDFVEEFDSITKACEKYGTGVQKVLRGQQSQCKGYLFEYKS